MAKKKTKRERTKKRPAKKPAAAVVQEEPTPTTRSSASEEIDRKLARAALAKKRAGETPTRRELQALKRIEKLEEERLRWDYYRTIPQAHYRKMSGRQPKILNDQGARYGLPFNRATIDLTELLPALHQFLADNAAVLTGEDALLTGPNTQSLERLRRAQADRVEMQNERDRKELLPAGDVHRVYMEIAATFRTAFDSVIREFGSSARRILEEAIEQADKRLEGFLNE